MTETTSKIDYPGRVETILKEETLAAQRVAALFFLRGFPVIDSEERGDVTLETRLIGTFAPEVAQRDIRQLQSIIQLQGLMQDLLTDENNSPSTTFDPKAGQVTITTLKSLLG